MQHFKVRYSIRAGPDFIHFTGPGQIKAGFYSHIFEKKKLSGPCFIHNQNLRVDIEIVRVKN